MVPGPSGFLSPYSLVFATLTAAVEYNHRGMGWFFVLAGAFPKAVGLKPTKVGDLWIFAWYIYIAGLLAGQKSDFEPFVTLLSTIWKAYGPEGAIVQA